MSLYKIPLFGIALSEAKNVLKVVPSRNIPIASLHQIRQGKPPPPSMAIICRVTSDLLLTASFLRAMVKKCIYNRLLKELFFVLSSEDGEGRQRSICGWFLIPFRQVGGSSKLVVESALRKVCECSSWFWRIFRNRLKILFSGCLKVGIILLFWMSVNGKMFCTH